MSRPILTAAEMRAAEGAAIDAGTPAATLMERAGAGAAEAIWRFAGPMPTLVLCGPGNNGGDGYVVARRLAERGAEVRVAALAEPRSEEAAAARRAWRGPVEVLGEAGPAPRIVDALFGTGLGRPLDEAVARRLGALGAAARLRVALDLPSGAATDDGALLSEVPAFDLTVTFGSLKPSHLLQPAASRMGRIVVADIGLETASRLHAIGRPRLAAPGPGDHKYSRGYVAMFGGAMAGAAALSAEAALRAGAGYVRLIGPRVAGIARAIVQDADPATLEDPRLDAVAIGPGLGKGEQEDATVDLVLGAKAPAIIDADALTLIGRRVERLHRAAHVPILTPHEGELARLFPDLAGSKVERARQAAAAARAVLVLKGADTAVAAPDGRAALAAPPAWLASAGTGDVLTGIVAAMRARGLGAFEAACAGVWLHGRAAELAGPGLIADDLLDALPAAFAECL